MANIDELPIEVIISIFDQAPCMDVLVKFSSVCKRWHLLIDSHFRPKSLVIHKGSFPCQREWFKSREPILKDQSLRINNIEAMLSSERMKKIFKFMRKFKIFNMFLSRGFDSSLINFFLNLEQLEIDYILTLIGSELNLPKLKYFYLEFCGSPIQLNLPSCIAFKTGSDLSFFRFKNPSNIRWIELNVLRDSSTISGFSNLIHLYCLRIPLEASNFRITDLRSPLFLELLPNMELISFCDPPETNELLKKHKRWLCRSKLEIQFIPIEDVSIKLTDFSFLDQTSYHKLTYLSFIKRISFNSLVDRMREVFGENSAMPVDIHEKFQSISSVSISIIETDQLLDFLAKLKNLSSLSFEHSNFNRFDQLANACPFLINLIFTSLLDNPHLNTVDTNHFLLFKNIEHLSFSVNGQTIPPRIVKDLLQNCRFLKRLIFLNNNGSIIVIRTDIDRRVYDLTVHTFSNEENTNIRRDINFFRIEDLMREIDRIQ